MFLFKLTTQGRNVSFDGVAGGFKFAPTEELVLICLWVRRTRLRAVSTEASGVLSSANRDYLRTRSPSFTPGSATDCLMLGGVPPETPTVSRSTGRVVSPVSDGSLRPADALRRRACSHILSIHFGVERPRSDRFRRDCPITELIGNRPRALHYLRPQCLEFVEC